ncbi:hypothetical protein BX600DRAFT_109604 [Xylariales sp. PMI_506]|nr:hypothetical protein BX600DRAFT_109604 [Xylariales sp. PMI_506]
MSLIGGKAAHPAAAAWAQERMYLQEQCKEIARAEENSSENNASGQSMDEANEDNIPNETPEDWLQLWAQQSKQIQDLMVKYKEELETLKARHQLEKNQFLRKYLDNALPKTSRCLEKHLVDRLDPVQAPGGSPLRKAQPITTNDNPPIESRNPTAPAPTVEDGGGVPDKPVQGISTISTTLTEAQSPPGSREVLYGFIQRRHIDGKVRLMFCVRGRMAQAKRQAAELCHTTKRPRLGDKQTDNNVIPDRITQSILTTGAERPMPQLPQGLNTQASSQSQPGLTLQPEGPTHERSLTYAQVRDNAIKHGHWDTIIEHPQDSKKWYVLFCEEHGVHFKPMALGGAAKHLHSKYHTGFDNRNRDNALKHLGYRIIDCTTALQASHNAQVEQAYMNGYKPADIKSFRSSRNKSSPTKSLQVNSTRNSLLIITHPQQFYLYYGEYKEKGVVRYWPVLILGWDDQRPGGLKGRLASLDTSGLLRDEAELPECYVYSNDKKRITGWAPGYEDNGSYVQMREFPVVFFDETMSTGWIPASELSELDLHRPETGPAYPAWALHDARRFIANREGFPSWEKREEKKTKGRPNMSGKFPNGHI